VPADLVFREPEVLTGSPVSCPASEPTYEARIFRLLTGAGDSAGCTNNESGIDDIPYPILPTGPIAGAFS